MIAALSFASSLTSSSSWGPYLGTIFSLFKCSHKSDICFEFVSDIPQNEIHESLGCFKNDKSNPLLTERVIELSWSNLPTRCTNICDSLGYAYAGVERGFVQLLIIFNMLYQYRERKSWEKLDRDLCPVMGD